MNRYTLYFLGLFLGAVCGVSASMGTMPSLDDYGVVSEKGSRLAKDATLSGLYNRTLADLSELQGAAEMVRELHALADWTGLKKGKAPRHFHKRLSTLKKTVRQTEWLTDEQKQLVASLIDRLGKKKQRHATEAAVFGSLTAAVVVAWLSAMVVAKMRNNTRKGYCDKSDFDDDETPGSGGDGGMASIKPNDRAALGRGYVLPTAPPLAAPAESSWWDILRLAPQAPTGVQPSHFPDAPTTRPDTAAGYDTVPQPQVGIPLLVQSILNPNKTDEILV
jgi:hypothetical protein